MVVCLWMSALCDMQSPVENKLPWHGKPCSRVGSWADGARFLKILAFCEMQRQWKEIFPQTGERVFWVFSTSLCWFVERTYEQRGSLMGDNANFAVAKDPACLLQHLVLNYHNEKRMSFTHWFVQRERNKVVHRVSCSLAMSPFCWKITQLLCQRTWVHRKKTRNYFIGLMSHILLTSCRYRDNEPCPWDPLNQLLEKGQGPAEWAGHVLRSPPRYSLPLSECANRVQMSRKQKTCCKQVCVKNRSNPVVRTPSEALRNKSFFANHEKNWRSSQGAKWAR